MSFPISNIDYANDVWEHVTQSPIWNVRLLLILPALVSGYLLIYVDGTVIATLTATFSPQAEAYPRSRFRGLPIFLLYRLAKILLISIIPINGFSLLKCFVINVVTDMLLSNLEVANIHVILDPSPRIPLYRRIPGWSTWQKTFPAALLYSAASSICFYAPVETIRTLGVQDRGHGPLSNSRGAFELFAFFATIFILYFGAVVPTYAIFIRVAASTLPSQEQKEQEQGNTHSIKSAWQGFPWSGRVRFYQVMVKVLAVEILVAVFVIYPMVMALFHPVLHNDVVELLVRYAA